MILKHELDLIFMEKSQNPIPESNPCWEWIAKQFKMAVKRLENYSPTYVDFCLYKDGTFTCSIYSNYDYEDKDFEPSKQFSPFSYGEVISCKAISEYNGISFSITPQPKNSFTGCTEVIQFIY